MRYKLKDLHKMERDQKVMHISYLARVCTNVKSARFIVLLVLSHKSASIKIIELPSSIDEDILGWGYISCKE